MKMFLDGKKKRSFNDRWKEELVSKKVRKYGDSDGGRRLFKRLGYQRTTSVTGFVTVEIALEI